MGCRGLVVESGLMSSTLRANAQSTEEEQFIQRQTRRKCCQCRLYFKNCLFGRTNKQIIATTTIRPRNIEILEFWPFYADERNLASIENRFVYEAGSFAVTLRARGEVIEAAENQFE
ncbi:hypothetical protein BaRGS_00012742 [Batillaria attramentaria]|uniref:Uncharacterized protein n=1 Tax=Batillaria attramentaria TaxID=370345 RepID=A0ABD0L9S1_9CAEN